MGPIRKEIYNTGREVSRKKIVYAFRDFVGSDSDICRSRFQSFTCLFCIFSFFFFLGFVQVKVGMVKWKEICSLFY